MEGIKVKVCGITNQEDAFMALDLGADILGFIFAPSPRQVSPQTARAIVRSVSPFAKTVGVFVNAEPAEIRRIAAYCGLDLVQLHGEETPACCEELMPAVIKAFRLRDAASLAEMETYRGHVRGLLFDSYADDRRGGTGRTFDWGLAVRGKSLRLPVILAGGLDPRNIEEAILTVRPAAVDVNSGVEERPGKKDRALLEQVMQAVGKASAALDQPTAPVQGV